MCEMTSTPPTISGLLTKIAMGMVKRLALIQTSWILILAAPLTLMTLLL